MDDHLSCLFHLQSTGGWEWGGVSSQKSNILTQVYARLLLYSINSGVSCPSQEIICKFENTIWHVVL